VFDGCDLPVRRATVCVPDPSEDAMTEAAVVATARRPALVGQTVVVLGGSSGIGLATARQARAEGAEVILTARDPEHLRRAADEVGAADSAAFDATDFSRLAEFFDSLPGTIDHIMVSGSGPYYAPLDEIDLGSARRDIDQHVFLPVQVARHARGRVRPGGSVLLISGTGGRRVSVGFAMISMLTAGIPALARTLALEIAPVRVNVVAAGFVDTRLSATLLGEGLEERRRELRSTLPIGRVVGPDDVAALALHLMVNTALTGATYDVDGGQQIV
jgi:NAD(P)-dependent dehydrogenase (short-subunit alcohol dehydrogenase family)